MSASELERLHWMQALAERRATQREVAGHLGLGVRQVQRLRDAYVARRVKGLVFARRGKPSNRRLAKSYRDQVLEIIRARCAGFGAALAHEKLVEQHGIAPALETLRLSMAAAGSTREGAATSMDFRSRAGQCLSAGFHRGLQPPIRPRAAESA